MEQPIRKSLDDEIRACRNNLRLNDWKLERDLFDTSRWNDLDEQLWQDEEGYLAELILKKYKDGKAARDIS